MRKGEMLSYKMTAVYGIMWEEDGGVCSPLSP